MKTKSQVASGTEFYRTKGKVPVSIAISKDQKRALASATFGSECRSIRQFIEIALNNYITNKKQCHIKDVKFDGTMTIFIDPKLRTQLRIEATSSGITLRKLAGLIISQHVSSNESVLGVR